MTLKERLLNDFKEAMRNKDNLLKDTIQIVRAGVLQIEKDSKTTLEDDGVIGVISKELKKRSDVLPDYERSGRQDLIDEINTQIQILKSYLPEQLSKEEIFKIIKDTINEIGAESLKDMGKVMQAVAPKLKGKADNKLVSEIVKESLLV